MGLFDGFNQFSQRNAQSGVPRFEDELFLKEICEYSKAHQITDKVSYDFEQIGDGIDEVIEYNNSIDTNDKNDYRLVKLSDDVVNLYQKAKDRIGELQTGGIIKYRKEKLRTILAQSICVPKQYDWELEYMTFYPEDYNRKLKPKGNWILILEDECVVSAPKKYSIHYATPTAKRTDAYGGTHKRWLASIIVNNREVLMYPHEYIIIKDANLLLDMIDRGVTMIEGSKSARLDKNKVFYLKSRGFSQSDIYKILFKSISSKGFCHFQADGEMAHLVDGMKKGVNPEFLIKIQKHRDNLTVVKFKELC